MAIEWAEWSGGAFARARDARRPVLLSIVTAWSAACAHMDRTTYADPAVARLVRDRFVPVRVDADRRPDISARYTLGGWPTTAFLTPDGEVLGGGTYVTAERMPAVLRQAAEAFAARASGGPGSPRRVAQPRATSRPGPPPGDLAAIAAGVFASFDRALGTFAGPAGFPHTAPIHLALDLWQTDADEGARDLAIRALDAVGWTGLYDEAGGGFFRCAAGPGWQNPECEKLLDVNAALLSLYVRAVEALDLARYRQRVVDVVAFLQTQLADQPEGGWMAWGGADRAAPILFTDANASAASALIHAARLMEDDSLAAYAIRSLERVLLGSYRPGAGVAHFSDGEPRGRGMLEDQVAAIRASLDAWDATGDVVYEMMAEELSHFVVRTLHDPETGGFLDRPPAEAEDIGLLREPCVPFVANCAAARALARVAAASGEAAFAATARSTLDALASSVDGQGPLAAEYVLAVREITRGDTLPPSRDAAQRQDVR